MTDEKITTGSSENIPGLLNSLADKHLTTKFWGSSGIASPIYGVPEPVLEFRYLIQPNGEKILQHRYKIHVGGSPIAWSDAPKDIPEVTSENKKIINKGSVWLMSVPTRIGIFAVYVTRDVYDTDDVVFVKDVSHVFPNPFFSAALEFDSKNQFNIDDRILSIKTFIDNAVVMSIPFSYLIQEMKLPD